jgi:lipoteichoic acid synthase
MTISGHSRYNKDGNTMARKNWDAFPEQYAQMPDAIRAYMACNLELEYALAYLVGMLEEKGIADDTVIALTSDHHPYALAKGESWGNEEDYLPILYGFDIKNVADRDHNALIIWSGSLEGEHRALVRTIRTPTYPPDILPTLCNLFGLKYDSRLLVGRDVFSDAEPLAIWNTGHWKSELGFYNATRNRFTPSDPDAVIPDGYVERIKNVVRYKIGYSRAALDYDYFGVLFDDDGELRR